MLILGLRPGERIVIAGGIVIEQLTPGEHGPRVAIHAPRNIGIWREAVAPKDELPTFPRITLDR